MTNDLEAVRVLLSRLGISPEQLTGPSTQCHDIPTIDQYLIRLTAAVPAGTLRVYGPYWQRIREAWRDRKVTEPTPLEIESLAKQVRANAVLRKNSRGGRSAAEHLVGALRCMYRHAVADGLIPEHANPAIRVAKPRRLPSSRRAIPPDRLEEIYEVAGSTGNDPELDALLLRLHTETACRRGGALALRPADLDIDQYLIRLREKGETSRWQPVSPTLMSHLLEHGDERGSSSTDPLLRYANGRPLTARRYDYLWKRIGAHLPWVLTQQVTTHWLRHTTLTWVERAFGYSVARAYAGHTGRNDAGSTSTYVRADINEVAQALATLTGEWHPLAKNQSDRSGAMPAGLPLTSS